MSMEPDNLAVVPVARAANTIDFMVYGRWVLVENEILIWLAVGWPSIFEQFEMRNRRRRNVAMCCVCAWLNVSLH